MQLNRLLLLLPLTTMLLLGSCKKNQSDEKYVEDPTIIIPDLTQKINTSVAGFIVDENNAPVGGATVTAGSKSALTDEYGYFSIANTMLPKTAGSIGVIKNGYFKNYRTFNVTEGKEAFVRMKLLTKTAAGNIAATAGGTFTTIDGGKITLPANGIVVAASGTAYSGTVNIAARLIDLSAVGDLQLSQPGDGRAIDKDGHLKLLRSYATMVVELTGDNNQKLQIATGSTATIVLPIAASMAAAAPASIPLWSLDETTGLWKEEGTAVKSGNTYTGNVSHFSFWEGADPSQLVNFSAQVVNQALQPLANVAVVIDVTGVPVNAGYGRFGYTDANGMISGPVPANRSLVLTLATTCALPVYAHNFTTGSSAVDLGTLTGNIGQSMVTVSGTAVNCAGQPITNGYVQLYDGGFNNHINIVNGVFNFTGLACTNGSVKYIVVDNATHQQSLPQNFNLVTGNNNLGTLTACGTSSISTFVYTYDGVTFTITEPVDTMAAFSFNNSSTNIFKYNMGGSSGSPTISFEINGGYALGSDHFTYDIWLPDFPSGRGKLPTPITVTITEYGASGGFISGSFDNTLALDFVDNSIHYIKGNFRVKRYN